MYAVTDAYSCHRQTEHAQLIALSALRKSLNISNKINDNEPLGLLNAERQLKNPAAFLRVLKNVRAADVNLSLAASKQST